MTWKYTKKEVFQTLNFIVGASVAAFIGIQLVPAILSGKLFSLLLFCLSLKGLASIYDFFNVQIKKRF